MIALKTYLLAATHIAAGAVGSLLFNGMVYQPHLKKDAQMGARAVIAARRIEATATQVALGARDLNDNQQEMIRETTRTIIKAIPVYVPSRSDALRGSSPAGGTAPIDPLSLPVGFGRLHDYAALWIDPPVPAPSGESLAAPSGIDLPGLAHTLVSNYGMCHADWQEVEAWRGWYRTQEAAWPK